MAGAITQPPTAATIPARQMNTTRTAITGIGSLQTVMAFTNKPSIHLTLKKRFA
jgi:hypothetical protein